MEKLIDTDALEGGKFHGVESWTPIEASSWQRGWNDAIDAIISNVSTVDAPEVVRCKDCMYRYGNVCDYSAVYVRPHGYCQWGRRKEDETD